MPLELGTLVPYNALAGSSVEFGQASDEDLVLTPSNDQGSNLFKGFLKNTIQMIWLV